MKTNKGLVEYAKKAVGNPYWYGTYGQIATVNLLNYKKRQYPSYYKARDFNSQVGKKVWDCVGLIKGYIWSDTFKSNPKYNSSQDVSANGMYTRSYEKGRIDTMPNIDGILVYKGSSTTKITHVGVYCTDGYVYEAKGHAYGVVKTKFKNKEWKYWSKCPFIEYDESKIEEIKKEEDNKKPLKIDYANLFDKSIAGKYKTTSDLNIRTGAGTSKQIIKVLRNKTRVTCYGYYSKVGTTKWFLVKTDDGVIGFVSSKYLRGY